MFKQTQINGGILLVALILCVWASNSYAQARPDSHAPIGVMGDHTHNEGEVMVSYRLMGMSMSGMQSGFSEVSLSDLKSTYMMSPKSMDMTMHMTGIMWAPTDVSTIMVMLPYVQKSMVAETQMGVEFTTKSQGLGDAQIALLHDIYRDDISSAHINMGLSIPTGKVNNSDDTPMSDDARLPYPMQLGTGTIDLKPGVTYLYIDDNFSGGARFITTIRTGQSSEGYRWGNRGDLTLWVAKPLCKELSVSTRIKYSNWGKIQGSDDNLNAAMSPAANPDYHGGSLINLGLGLNFLGHYGLLTNHRLSLEWQVPVYQNLNGTQMTLSSQIIAGWQYAL